MKTDWVFSEDTGELIYSQKHDGNTVVRHNLRGELGVPDLVRVTVCEGETAEREFFNHFGDDSSWPPGWYRAVTGSRDHSKLRTKPLGFTRESWTAENYPASKVSWQEYFGVHCPKWYI